MRYKLYNDELEQMAKIYETDVSTLAEKLDLDDEIISFQPYTGGIEIKTKKIERLILRFKNELKL